MSITGIERVIYGVDDLPRCTRFYEQFGLPLIAAGPERAEFLLAEGSRVVLLPHEHPSLPPRFAAGNSVREVIWGVSSARALDATGRELAQDRPVVQDADGVLHSVDDSGIPFGLRVFEQKPVLAAPSPVNSPGITARLNENRKWYRQPEPKSLIHVVFRTPNQARASAFYRTRLGFRLSDVSRGVGTFMRAPGNSAHHNLFLIEAPTSCFDHICFGVEDIDELMAGAARVRGAGYTTNTGIGRHRISSALYYYFDNPCGGQAEYAADMDQLDDRWQPREWEPLFGLIAWAAEPPPFMPHEASWDFRILSEGETR